MELELVAKDREVLGKKVSRLRRAGYVPANLYGPTLAPRALEVPLLEAQALLRRAGTNALVNLRIEGESKSVPVLMSEVQIKPTTQALLHLSMFAVNLKEKMKADVPVVWTGESPAVRATNRMLLPILDHLQVECLPTDIPNSIEIDVSHLDEPDDAIHVKDVAVRPDVTILNDPEDVIVKVVLSRAGAAEDEEEGAAEAAGGEEAAEEAAGEETAEPGETPAGSEE